MGAGGNDEVEVESWQTAAEAEENRRGKFASGKGGNEQVLGILVGW
jgi:hypothetical protein